MSKQHDFIPEKYGKPDPTSDAAKTPTHTDMMVTPESIAGYMEREAEATKLDELELHMKGHPWYDKIMLAVTLARKGLMEVENMDSIIVVNPKRKTTMLNDGWKERAESHEREMRKAAKLLIGWRIAEALAVLNAEIEIK